MYVSIALACECMRVLCASPTIKAWLTFKLVSIKAMLFAQTTIHIVCAICGGAVRFGSVPSGRREQLKQISE